MKKIIIAISALAVLLMSSCTKDFVTVQHNSAEPMDAYFIDESRMYESLVAAYHPLGWFDYCFGAYNDLRLVSDIMADDVYCGGSNASDQITLVKTHFYTATPIEHCGGIWTAAYSGVNRSCVVLEYVDGVPGMSEETKALYKAEATVLKAWYYTLLWKFWGNIPYYDVNLTAPYTAPQLPADEVYTRIVTKIEEAIAMNALPAVASQKGRVTKDMAYMLYAEVVMYQNDESRYSTALNYMKEIIDSGRYSLVSDFKGMWEETGEWGPESIWEINYTSVGANRGWDGGQSIAAGGSVLPVLCGIPGGTSEFVDGWGFGPIAAHAYEMYAEGDQRRDGGIYNHLEVVGEYGFNINNGRWQSTGYFNRKTIARLNGNHDALGDGNLAHCNNYRVYRYAETLLNAAELAVLTGGDGSAYLKQVRDRAGASYEGNDRDSILEERRREFLGEGKRYWDLVRSGKAAEVLKAANHEYRETDWTVDKKYWPIPQSEIDKDPALVQNNY
ncbi:MAG: RagB/SusD family nutrient uptake outer membrane protein [Bacteroidales bacterium]|nr:RagB/SusD family nutrient uptake outer membrane protein [Bacteroidales bacterium]MBQ8856469.1 RagB/SusD family nutrient uptake outer membrane protein [Bacteroidales bacterium]